MHRKQKGGDDAKPDREACTRARAARLSWTPCSGPSHNDASNTPELAYSRLAAEETEIGPTSYRPLERARSHRHLRRAEGDLCGWLCTIIYSDFS